MYSWLQGILFKTIQPRIILTLSFNPSNTFLSYFSCTINPTTVLNNKAKQKCHWKTFLILKLQKIIPMNMFGRQIPWKYIINAELNYNKFRKLTSKLVIHYLGHVCLPNYWCIFKVLPYCTFLYVTEINYCTNCHRKIQNIYFDTTTPRRSMLKLSMVFH